MLKAKKRTLIVKEEDSIAQIEAITIMLHSNEAAEKWLKDRESCSLSFDDIQHYQRIVAVLAETITLMEKIEEVIDEHGGWPIE